MSNVYSLFRVSDWDMVKLIFKLIGIAGIPLTLLALWIILTNSSPQIKGYKWIIANLLVTTFLTDIVICFLFDPIPLFPEIACYSTTWIANISDDANYILLCVSIVMLQLTLSAALVAFIYRMNCLGILSATCLDFLHYRLRYTASAIVYAFSLIPVVVVLIIGYKPRSQMQTVIEKIPELKFLQNYGSYLAAEKNDGNFTAFQVIWLCSTFLIVVLCIVVAAVIIIGLHRRRQFMSQKSLELHRTLTIYLAIQTLIPVATILIPMLLLFFTRYMRVPFGAKFWNLVISHAVALHIPLNAITTMMATRRYHRHFKLFKSVSAIIHRIKAGGAVESAHRK